MISSDITIIINGQEFVVDGGTLKPAESNFQREVLKRLDGIDARLGNLESRAGNLENRVTAIAHQQELTAAKLDIGLWSMGICFAVLAVVVTFVGIFAPKFWEFFSRKSKPAPEIDIDEVADKVIEIISRRYELKPKR